MAEKRPNDYVPTERDFSGGAVQLAIFKETIQHPATILPLGASGGITGLMVFGLISANPVTLSLALGTGLFGTCVWIYNFFIRGDKLAEQYTGQLREQLNGARQRDAQRLRTECHDYGFREGSKEAGELETAYNKLHDYLTRQAKGEGLDAVRYGSLAKDIYVEGMDLVRGALEAHKALESIDVEGLKSERDSWQRQLRRKDITTAEAKSLQTKIDSHASRINTHEQHAIALQDSLSKIEDLEAALEKAYLELVDITRGHNVITPGESASRLERAIAAARRVDQKLSGEDTRAEDEQYLRAARNKS